MKLTKTQLRQIIKEEIDNQLSLDFRTPEERAWHEAADAFDEWKDWEDPWELGDEEKLVKWMDSRSKMGGRQYRSFISRFAQSFGMYRQDLLNAAKRMGSQGLQRDFAKYLAGYRRGPEWRGLD